MRVLFRARCCGEVVTMVEPDGAPAPGGDVMSRRWWCEIWSGRREGERVSVLLRDLTALAKEDQPRR